MKRMRSLAGFHVDISRSTSVTAAYKSVLMALDNSRVTGEEGIVEDSVDASIANLCALASESMVHTDRQILEIMVSKVC